MLSNAYFLAKIRFDKAENEPAKKCKNWQEIANFAGCAQPAAAVRDVEQVDAARSDPLVHSWTVSYFVNPGGTEAVD